VAISSDHNAAFYCLQEPDYRSISVNERLERRRGSYPTNKDPQLTPA
jgi:hypothetical protein